MGWEKFASLMTDAWMLYGNRLIPLVEQAMTLLAADKDGPLKVVRASPFDAEAQMRAIDADVARSIDNGDKSGSR